MPKFKEFVLYFTNLKEIWRAYTFFFCQILYVVNNKNCLLTYIFLSVHTRIYTRVTGKIVRTKLNVQNEKNCSIDDLEIYETSWY